MPQPIFPTAVFDPQGGPLIARIVCGQAQTGGYTYYLWNSVTGSRLDKQEGRFWDTTPDEFVLAKPVAQHHFHAVEFLGRVTLLPPITAYHILVEVLQDGRVVSEVPPMTGAGTPHQTVTFDLFVLLVDRSRASAGGLT